MPSPGWPSPRVTQGLPGPGQEAGGFHLHSSADIAGFPCTLRPVPAPAFASGIKANLSQNASQPLRHGLTSRTGDNSLLAPRSLAEHAAPEGEQSPTCRPGL